MRLAVQTPFSSYLQFKVLAAGDQKLTLILMGDRKGCCNFQGHNQQHSVVL